MVSRCLMSLSLAPDAGPFSSIGGYSFVRHRTHIAKIIAGVLLFRPLRYPLAIVAENVNAIADDRFLCIRSLSILKNKLLECNVPCRCNLLGCIPENHLPQTHTSRSAIDIDRSFYVDFIGGRTGCLGFIR
jgi:hypothetical protein